MNDQHIELLRELDALADELGPTPTVDSPTADFRAMADGYRRQAQFWTRVATSADPDGFGLLARAAVAASAGAREIARFWDSTADERDRET